METCPTCGKEIVALPEDLEKLGSEWLELSMQATEIKQSVEVLKAKIFAITERANTPTVNGRGWRVVEIFPHLNSLMHTRLANRGVEQDTIKYAIEATSEAKRQRLEDKGVSADILAYAFKPTRYDSEPRDWKLMRTK